MRNAKQEFLHEVNNKAIKCVEIRVNQSDIDLKIDFTDEEYTLFLEKLNIEYDSGYGGQELYGLIWYSNGDWSERGEYDGAEWWEYKTTPEIPKKLNS